MNPEKCLNDMAAMGLNLYDAAFYTDDGLFARRFQPCNACNDSYSVAKAFVMTAIGLLYDRQQLSVGDRIVDLFAGELSPADASRWSGVTVEHALTHTIGFDEGFLDIDVEDTGAYPTDDYLSMVFSHPLLHKPGTHRQYSDAAFYLLSRVVSQVSGENVDSLLYNAILRPLGFHEVAWSRCPHGYPIGATGLYIRSDDMVKLGWLYLNGGVWNGERLLSRQWVDMVTEKGYELQPAAPNGLIGKGGMHGQGLFFSEKARFAAAWHAFDDSSRLGDLMDYLNALCQSPR